MTIQPLPIKRVTYASGRVRYECGSWRFLWLFSARRHQRSDLKRRMQLIETKIEVVE